MSEEWRAVKDYEGLYEVSNQGRVRSLTHETVCSNGVVKRYRGRMLCSGDNGAGYRRVVLTKNGRQTSLYVHRLVAIAFLAAPLEGQITVNHKFGISSDNRVSELEWATQGENVQHAYDTGLHNAKLTRDEVAEIRQLYAEGHTQYAIAHAFSVSRGAIAHILANRNWKQKPREEFFFTL